MEQISIKEQFYNVFNTLNSEQQNKIREALLEYPMEEIPKNNCFINYSGRKYDRLLALYPTIKRRQNAVTYVCLCDCGNIVSVKGGNLASGNSNSCGCRQQGCQRQMNRYDLTGEYGIGYTNKGEPFYFDLEDYDLIKNFCWYINKRTDVEARDYEYGTEKLIKMHRLIMHVDDPQIKVDHIYHNPDGSGRRYDNRKLNLRITTHMDNMKNVKPRSNNTSGYTGVQFDKRKNKYFATITHDKQVLFLGYYVDILDAIKVRKAAEEKYFGEYQYQIWADSAYP